MKSFYILLIGLALSQACTKNKLTNSNNNDRNAVETGDCVENVKATLVDKTGLDGCTWTLRLKDGSFLEPTNLSDFSIELVNDKPVVISYTVRSDLVSICMIGPIVDIDCMQE